MVGAPGPGRERRGTRGRGADRAAAGAAARRRGAHGLRQAGRAAARPTGRQGAGGPRGTSRGRGRGLRGGWATCGGDRESERQPWGSGATVACVGRAGGLRRECGRWKTREAFGADRPRRARVSEYGGLQEGNHEARLQGHGWTGLGIHGRGRLCGMTTNPYHCPRRC